MKRITPIVLGMLCLLPAALRAESSQDITRLFPQDSHFAVKIRSMDRLDAIAKEWIPYLRQFDAAEVADVLEKMPLSAIFAKESKLDITMLDRTKACYMVMAPPGGPEVEQPMLVGHAAPGTALEGEKEMPEGYFAVQRGSALIAARKPTLALAPRRTPTKTLDGDIVFHVYAADLNRIYKEQIDGAFAMGTMRAAGMPLPPAVQPMIAPLMKSIQGAVKATQSIDYALTWKGDHAIGQGLIATNPESEFHKSLKSVGAAGQPGLAALLPDDAFLIYDFHAEGMGQMMKALGGKEDETGPSVGAAVRQLLSLTSAFSESLSGESAGSMSMAGMMAANVTSIAKLKEGVDVAKMFDAFDAAKMNEAFKAVGLPLQMKLHKNTLKHGEIALHRLEMRSDHPQFGMLAAMMQTYLAAGHGHLVSVMSPTGADDVRSILDRLAAGKARGSAHLTEMARLGGKRNMGLTINVSALRNVMMMGAMLMPEVAQIANAIPDGFVFSTAVDVSSGNIEWKGNWPVAQIAKVAGAVNGMKPGKKAKKPAEKDEDFD